MKIDYDRHSIIKGVDERVTDASINYTEESIQVLEGLDAVRKRPAMYIGSTDIKGLHHLAYEIIDNAVDEELSGYCDDYKVILHLDDSITIVDNGRGIPVGLHKSCVPIIDAIVTIIHVWFNI